jgi:hypothetical protein
MYLMNFVALMNASISTGGAGIWSDSCDTHCHFGQRWGMDRVAVSSFDCEATSWTSSTVDKRDTSGPRDFDIQMKYGEDSAG